MPQRLNVKEAVEIHPEDIVKIYGPYNQNSNDQDSLYLTISFKSYKAKIPKSNTLLDLKDISINQISGTNKQFRELNIKNPDQIIWIKNTRNRSQNTKFQVLDKIIAEGRKLFSTPNLDFSMRELAKICEMTVGNLYAYIQSKRDLWYAIIIHDFHILENKMAEIRKKYSKNFQERLIGYIKEFISFAREDITRYRMMFFIPQPPPKINNQTGIPLIGPYEENFRDIEILHLIIKEITDAAESQKINVQDPERFTYILLGMIQGNILYGYDYNLLKKKPIEEYDRDFINYLLQFLQNQIFN